MTDNLGAIERASEQMVSAAIPTLPRMPMLGIGGISSSHPQAEIVKSTIPKQPIIIQMVTPDLRVLAEMLVDDISSFQGTKQRTKELFEGGTF
ncbi:hypothetical protein [Cytobacillus firmus]|uniref:hypothetical protein n=1 Tax=Cytobacillus firmus TaxID=1399 RepID=UPI001C8EFD39|nr:hypothetical protein [Cytobacillus firmus]MBX9972541.1 hypothetical protein [Cytobacillus firmus]